MNLSATQSMMGMLAGIGTADNDHLEDKLTQARWFAGVGTAGPAIVAGTMLIMFRIAMALFVGFAPIFILCLLFKKTAPLFQKWLYYGLATIFSGVMLGVMADISMDLVSNIAVTDAVANIASVLVGNGQVGSIMQTVTQQLGLGLMLSTLLITVPPMAGMFFNGVMGSYSGYNAMMGWNGGQPTTPPGMNSQQQIIEERANQVTQSITQNQTVDQPYSNFNNKAWAGTSNIPTNPSESVKTLAQAEKAVLNTTISNATVQVGQPKITDKEKGDKA